MTDERNSDLLKKLRSQYEFGKPDWVDDERAWGAYVLADPKGIDDYLGLDPLRFSEQQQDEWSLRLIRCFIESVYNGETPPKYVMECLALQLEEVVRFGSPWESAFPLPWTKTPTRLTRAQFEAERIFEKIRYEHKRALERDPGTAITATIRAVADSVGVSYETAAGAYYKHRNKLKSEDLKNDDEI